MIEELGVRVGVLGALRVFEGVIEGVIGALPVGETVAPFDLVGVREDVIEPVVVAVVLGVGVGVG